ncbi:hypothetical protein [Undibacterium flavidum]|uniref:Uncharacterized protein n=1 Tax=Undibacterium flavidum TaxID=2762297 RepID=A0ABR6YBG5_9BURK|nr:hypothetical protein [Undibacterium flavidum]MBC3873972.1 hypothetical protein [Undibacterium flavidum]
MKTRLGCIAQPLIQPGRESAPVNSSTLGHKMRFLKYLIPFFLFPIGTSFLVGVTEIGLCQFSDALYSSKYCADFTQAWSPKFVDFSLFAFIYLIFFTKFNVDRSALAAIVLGTFAMSAVVFLGMNRGFESVLPGYSTLYILLHSLVKALLPIVAWLVPNFLFNKGALKRAG